MAQRSLLSSLLLLLIPLFSSCIVGSHPAGIASSTAPVFSNYTVLGSVEESSCSYQVLVLLLGKSDPVEQLIEKAVKTLGGDALAGVTVELRSSTLFLPLARKDCTIVQGLVVKNVR